MVDEMCGETHPDFPDLCCCYTHEKFHLSHICRGDGESFAWVNERDQVIWDAWELLKRRRGRPKETFGEFIRRSRETAAAPLAVSPNATEPLALGHDPRPPWTAHALTVIEELARERPELSALNVWPSCAFPRGFGGAGLMKEPFKHAERDGTIAVKLNPDGTAKGFHRESCPTVLSLDHTMIRLPEVVVVYRSLLYASSARRS